MSVRFRSLSFWEICTQELSAHTPVVVVNATLSLNITFMSLCTYALLTQGHGKLNSEVVSYMNVHIGIPS